MWIRDLLRSKLPNPKIMTFGYNANLYTDCAAGRIKDFANNLYSMLEDERETPQVSEAVSERLRNQTLILPRKDQDR